MHRPIVLFTSSQSATVNDVMNPSELVEQRAEVEEFRRKHRVGLSTLLFTDLVGSTQLKQRLGDREAVALIQQHHALVREVLRRFEEAQEISTAGDSFFLLFAKPSDAVQFALLLQARLRVLATQITPPLLDRIGLHLGEVVIEERPDAAKTKDLYGLQVDICARVMSLAEGNQILMTRAVFDSARQVLRGHEMEGVKTLSWFNHGPYALKGVEEPLEICEVGETGAALLQPPPDSEKVHRHVSADAEPVLGWRPALGQLVPNTQWELENKLGEGGFGEVWLGRHQTMKERRVFKFCFRAERVRFLKREMTLFRLLKERVGDHPNIVSIREVYFDSPPYYVVMDYVESSDLRIWCEQQGGADKAPLETKLEIVAQIADALQAAHDSGVIHRDVKPANILVRSQKSEVRSQDGGVPQPSAINSQPLAKLTDFGIGQVVSEEFLKGVTRAGFTQTVISDSSSSHTGTQIYMAPELLAGKPASIRSDIYSLGVVLYQLLVGDFSRPVTTDWANEIADPLVRDDLKHCFAGNPNDRFAGAGQLAKNLRGLPQRQRALEEQQAELAAKERAAYRRGIIRTAAAAFVLIAAFAGLAVYAFKQARRTAAANLETQKANQALTQASERTQQAYAQVTETLSQLELQKINELCASGEYGRAVGYLARALRQNPDNYRAGYRLLSILTQRNIVRPIKEKSYEGRVLTTAFGPSGPLLMTVDREQKIWVWNFHQEKPLAGPLGPVTRLAWAQLSPSGKKYLISFSNVVQVCSIDHANTPAHILKHSGSVGYTRQFSPDESKLITASQGPLQNYRDIKYHVWDLATGQLIGESVGHNEYELNFTFTADGKQLVTRNYRSNRLRRLDFATGVWAPEEPAGTGPFAYSQGEDIGPGGFKLVRSHDPNRKGIQITSGSFGQREVLALGRLDPDGSGESLLSTVSSDGEQLLNVLRGNSVSLLDVGANAMVPAYVGEESSASPPVYGVFWAPPPVQAYSELSKDGLTLLALGADGTLRLWDVRSGRPIANSLGEKGKIKRARLSPDGQRVAVASLDDSVRLWDARVNKPVTEPFRPEKLSLNELGFSPDGRSFLTVWSDGSVRVCETDSGSPRFGPLKQASAVIFAHYSPDGKRLATACNDGTVRVWDALTGKPVTPPLQHDARVYFCQFSADGKRLLSSQANFVDAPGGISTQQGNSMSLWDVEKSSLITRWKEEQHVWSAQLSPDGQLVATAHGYPEQSVRIRNANTGGLLNLIKQENANFQRVAFAEEGKALATVGTGTVRIWDVKTATPLSEPLNIQSQYGGQLALTPLSSDGHHVVFAPGNGPLRVWELPQMSGPAPEWLPQLAEALCGERQSQEGLAEPPQVDAYERLKEKLLQSPNNDAYTRWAKWFLAERTKRSISPFSSISVQDHVKKCLELNSLSSVQEALVLEGNSVRVLSALARLKAADLFLAEDRYARGYSANPEGAKQQIAQEASLAERLAQDLFSLQAESPEAWHLRAVALLKQGKPQEALNAWNQVKTNHEDPQHLTTKGSILEMLNQTDGAYQDFCRAIEVASSQSANSASQYYLHRSAFLKRQKRFAEAANDICLVKKIPLRDPTTPTNLIDLSLNYTGSLASTNASNFSGPGDTFSEVPTGVHHFAGTSFDVRGIAERSSYGPSEKFESIAIGLKCKRLHFFQGVRDSGGTEGTPVGQYIVRYANQQKREIRILNGQHVRSLHFLAEPIEANNAVLAWIGTSEATRKQGAALRLFKMFWDNPLPDVVIKEIDFEGGGPGGTLFLIALTADPAGPTEAAPPNRPGPALVPEVSDALTVALEAAAKAIDRRPEYAFLWQIKASLLEKGDRNDEAFQAYSKAIELAETQGDSSKNALKQALRKRSSLLKLQNRLAEAAADMRRAIDCPPRDPKAKPNLIDLSAYYNVGLTESWHPGLGPSDFSDLPNGIQKLAGAEFDVRGLIQVGSVSRAGEKYPKRVSDIAIGRVCQRVHFLHSAINAFGTKDGAQLGTYVIHYANGQEHEIPIVVGVDVADWFNQPNETNKRFVIAWTGTNESSRMQGGRTIRLFKTTWENPAPAVEVKSIDFVSTMDDPAPFLIAITAEP